MVVKVYLQEKSFQLMPDHLQITEEKESSSLSHLIKTIVDLLTRQVARCMAGGQVRIKADNA